MKTGIIGLPQVGKTSLFKILTRADLSQRSSNPREAHIGIATVPDDRLDRLAAQCNPRKLVHAQVEFADMGAIGQEALKESAYLASLRGVDSIIHVLRAFEDEAIPHPAGSIDPVRDLRNVEFDLMVSDLAQVEARLERMKKDLLKKKTAELEKENELLQRAKAFLETELPLREMEMTKEEKKVVRGFMFLSEKPILYVLNIGESSTLGADLDAAVDKYGLAPFVSRLNTGATAICGKVEAELADMSEEEASEFLASYGLKESGLARLIRKSYELLGLISFFTVGEDECRAWTVEKHTRAQDAAGAIHTDLAKHFIRAETVHWDTLLELGSEAAARAAGKLRLEGKDYVVQDGDILHIRHSG
jgi:ribosome-binding ATPase